MYCHGLRASDIFIIIIIIQLIDIAIFIIIITIAIPIKLIGNVYKSVKNWTAAGEAFEG